MRPGPRWGSKSPVPLPGRRPPPPHPRSLSGPSTPTQKDPRRLYARIESTPADRKDTGADDHRPRCVETERLEWPAGVKTCEMILTSNEGAKINRDLARSSRSPESYNWGPRSRGCRYDPWRACVRTRGKLSIGARVRGGKEVPRGTKSKEKAPEKVALRGGHGPPFPPLSGGLLRAGFCLSPLDARLQMLLWAAPDHRRGRGAVNFLRVDPMTSPSSFRL